MILLEEEDEVEEHNILIKQLNAKKKKIIELLIRLHITQLREKALGGLHTCNRSYMPILLSTTCAFQTDFSYRWASILNKYGNQIFVSFHKELELE